MLKNVITLLALTAVGLAAGCSGDPMKDAKEKMKDAQAKAKEATDKVKEQTDKTVADAKEAFLKPIVDLLPKIKEAIAKLTDDKKSDAENKLGALTKLIDGFKEATPDKWESLKDGLTKAFEELKKLVGL